MKITDSEIIRNGEQELIDAITADLDWGAIEEIFKKEHKLGIDEDIEYKKGDIVTYNNQIAYSLEFEVKVNLSVILDRQGDYISINIPGVEGQIDEGNLEGPSDEQNNMGDGSKEELNDSAEINETGQDTHVENKTGEQQRSDSDPESRDEYKEALAELDAVETQPPSSDEGPEGKMTQMAARIGDLIDDIGSGIQDTAE